MGWCGGVKVGEDGAISTGGAKFGDLVFRDKSEKCSLPNATGPNLIAAEGWNCAVERTPDGEVLVRAAQRITPGERLFVPPPPSSAARLRCPRRWEGLPVGAVTTDVGGRDESWRPADPPPLREYPSEGFEGGVLSTSPALQLIPDFLSNAEVEHILALAEGRFRAAGETGGRRTSSGFLMGHGETEIHRAIERRAAALCGVPVEHVERFGFVKYEGGQHFSPHHDGSFRPQTIFVYLTDLPPGCGGRTIFPRLGVAVRPKKGWAVHWWNDSPLPSGGWWADGRMVHESERLSEGCKIGVNIFINSCPVQSLIADHSLVCAAIRAAGVVKANWTPPPPQNKGGGDVTQ
eukprot:Hpha_TRINITY_DN25910_c0_g1::TRINITY_DN25910_c0_g1_i1::g.185334::m.185334/K00472/P4HA; prolyl 4-hydroxylase